MCSGSSRRSGCATRPTAHPPDHGQPLHPLDSGIRDWAADNNVELVPTPTYASFLNRIECHFGAVGEFVIKNADYPDWDTLARAMADYIHLRNRTHGGGPIATSKPAVASPDQTPLPCDLIA